MIIYFEGLSCAGKSTLIKAVAETNQHKFFSIPELPTGRNAPKDINSEYCRKNDVYKIGIAKNEQKNGYIVLQDRGYLSTLTYDFIEYKNGKSSEYFNSLDWFYKQKLEGNFTPPHLYIFINITEEEAIKRAKLLGRYNDFIAWYNNPKYGKEYYEYFFKFIEPNIPILEFSNSMSIDTQVKEVLNKIDKMLEYA